MVKKWPFLRLSIRQNWFHRKFEWQLNSRISSLCVTNLECGYQSSFVPPQILRKIHFGNHRSLKSTIFTFLTNRAEKWQIFKLSIHQKGFHVKSDRQKNSLTYPLCNTYHSDTKIKASKSNFSSVFFFILLVVFVIHSLM